MTRDTEGATVTVATLPDCDFCRVDGRRTTALYDFRTGTGSWAHGCEQHWVRHRAVDRLGTGYGQRLLTPDPDQVTWLDQQDLDKVERGLGKYRQMKAALASTDDEAALAVAGWTRDVIADAGDDDRFGLWLAIASRALLRLVGMGHHDIEDYRWRDEYDAGTSPTDAAMAALRASDTYSGLFEGAGHE